MPPRRSNRECRNWRSFVDEPLFQLRPEWAEGMTERQMLARFRDRVAVGQAVFA